MSPEDLPLGHPVPLACIDCEHVRRRNAGYFTRLLCTHPAAAHLEGDPIYGYRTVAWRPCEQMRQPEAPCSPAGVLWVPRRAPIVRWMEWLSR